MAHLLRAKHQPGKYIAHAYSLVLLQFKQLLQYETKQETDWNTTSTSYNPLLLLQLIEKMILSQTEDQYPLATAMTRNLPSTHFTKAQLLIHSGMSASTQSLMSKCSAKKRDKKGHLLGFIPQTYFCLFALFINICTSFRNNFLYKSLSSCMYI